VPLLAAMEIASTAAQSRNDGLVEVCHDYQNVCNEDCQYSKHAENLLPEDPSLFVFHPSEEEISERIDRRLARKAIINGLVIFVRFEPEFVGVGKEDQAEEQEEQDKSQGGLGHTTFLPQRCTKEHKGF
jgi:hypothetical protein